MDALEICHIGGIRDQGDTWSNATMIAPPINLSELVSQQLQVIQVPLPLAMLEIK